jgi:hypothetical protein
MNQSHSPRQHSIQGEVSIWSPVQLRVAGMWKEDLNDIRNEFGLESTRLTRSLQAPCTASNLRVRSQSCPDV